MKKTSLLLLTAITAAMLSSCGTSTYYVSNIEDGIYYRPDSDTRKTEWQESRKISELKSRTASETGHAGAAHKSDTIVLGKGQSAAEIDYLPGKSYTILLNGIQPTDTLKNYYRVNINLNSYGYPYPYCCDSWRWGFGWSWYRFGYAWRPWYYDPWFYDPWYYSSWYRPYGPGWYNPYGPGWYPPYGPVYPIYVDPRPVASTHRAEADMGRSSYTGPGSRVTQISRREASVSDRRSEASIQDRNIRTSVRDSRQENLQARPAGSSEAVSQARAARSEAAAAVRSGASGAAGGQQSHLSDRRASYSNYRPASGNQEQRHEAAPSTVNSSGSGGRRGFTSESRSSGYTRYESVSRESRSSSESSQRSSYSSSERSSYSSGSSYSGGGGFSGGGNSGGGFSGGGGSRGGGGMRR